MQFCKLMDSRGRQIERPTAVEGSVAWSITEGKASAWDREGRTLLAELVGARVVWVGATGLRIEGLEPFAENRFRAQAWQLIF